MHVLSRLTALLLTLSVLAVGVEWFAFAQIRVEVTSPPVEAQPGEFVTLVVTVFNDGNTDETISLDFEFPKGFSALGTPQSLTVAAQSNESVFLTVLVSQQAVSGENQITITAISNADPTQSGSDVARVNVLQVPGLSVQSLVEVNAEPDEPFELSFSVTNNGNAMDQVALSVDAPRNVSITLQTMLLSLLPGESQTVEIAVSISTAVTPGRVRITLMADSTLFPEARAEATANVTLLPLLPQDVPGRLVLEVPSILSFEARAPDADTPAIFTYSLSGFANFNQADLIDYRLTIDNFTVRTLFFDLDREALRTRLGFITVTWSELLSFSGAGAQLTLKKLPFEGEVSVGALSDELLPQVGLQQAFTLDDLDVSLNHALHFNAEDQFDVLYSITLNQSVGENLTLFSEWAISNREGIRDLGVIIRTLLEFDEYDLQADLVRIGTDFVGNRSDEFGFSLRQTYVQDDFVISTSFRRFQDNVNADPLRTPTIDTSFLASARWSPDPKLPTMLFTANFNATQTGSQVTSQLTSILRLSQALGENASTGAFFQHTVNVDAQATDVSQLDTFLYGIDLAFVSQPLTASLAISQFTELDTTASTVTEQTLEASANLQLRGEIARFTLGAIRSVDEVSLSASLEAELGPWEASAQLNVDRQNNGDIDFSARAKILVEFDAPIPFLPIKGRIQGTVFEDLNDNGVQDAEERGIPDIVLVIGDVQARTDADGFYRSPPLEPGEYEINVTQLPLTLVAAMPLPQKASVAVGQTLNVNLALARVAIIEGVLYSDGDQSGTREPNEPGVAGVRILLDGEASSTFTTTAPDGSFVFADLSPGSYTVKLDALTLPARFEPTTPLEVEVVLEPGEQISVEFGAFQQPQIIKFAPTADFNVDPPNPVVNETVVFDGSTSFDPDGQVVAYEWDFDGDGQVDAAEPIATFVYETSGIFEVSLTVTDNEGNTDAVTKLVEVQP